LRTTRLDVATHTMAVVRACIGGIPDRSAPATTLVTGRFGRLGTCLVAANDKIRSAVRQLPDGVDQVLVLWSTTGASVERAVIAEPRDFTGPMRRPALLDYGLGVSDLFCPWAFVRVPELRRVDEQWVDLSHTYDGYWRAGGVDKALNGWRELDRSQPNGPRDLTQLRLALFLEARSDRHGGGVGESSDRIRELTEMIRTLSGGIVRDDRPLHL
jgi:hypothetical protein